MERTERRPGDPETDPPEADSTETRRDWEPVQVNHNDQTERLRINAGWLYRTVVYADDTSRTAAVAMTFIPDTPGA